jgi:hydrogenase-4 component F
VLLGYLSLQYLGCSFYVPGYLAMRRDRDNRYFCAALLGLLGTMSLVVIAHHLGLMWVAIETSTLTTAPLLYFNQNARSLEATWKYLLIGSVGVALALFGSFFLAYSALRAGLHSSLLFEDMVRDASLLSKPWLHSAFVVLLVGYGTKVGLAPMHTWKPDAYGEAPGLTGAMLSGAMTSCAFLAIVRIQRVMIAAGEGDFSAGVLVGMGLLSMAVAAAFVVRQRDFKRMLAYSSVEHMGILVLGLGLGGAGVFGAMLHLVNNGLVKGALFLAAGNIHRVYGSKSIEHVTGAGRACPISAAVFLAGFIAVTGSPPFAPFVSEFTIVNAAFGMGRYVVVGVFLLLLCVVFVGMGATVLGVVQGPKPDPDELTVHRETPLTTIPALVLLAAVLLLGVYLPPPLERLISDAANSMGVRP